MSWDTKKSALQVTVMRPMPAMQISQEVASRCDTDNVITIACDGVAIVPFWEGADIPRTQQARTWGPDGKPLPSVSLFQVWSMLTTDLANRADLPPVLRSMCALVHDLLEKALSKAPPPADPKAG